MRTGTYPADPSSTRHLSRACGSGAQRWHRNAYGLPGTEPNSGTKTIQINGKDYACSDLSKKACDQGVTDAFSEWGDKLEVFVNSDRLGTLGKGGSGKLADDRIARLGPSLLPPAHLSSIGRLFSERRVGRRRR